MKLIYNRVAGKGRVEGDASGKFTKNLALSFECDRVWYDERSGEAYVCKGYGRRRMSDAEIAELKTKVKDIALDP